VAAQPPDAPLVSTADVLVLVAIALLIVLLYEVSRPMKRAPTYRTPLCPVAAAHGHLLDWPSAFAAWYCPSSAHDITPFFNSDLEPVRASRAADTRALLGSSTGRKSP
jgi:hypothetical protein